MHLSGLSVYPVKSCRGLSLGEVAVRSGGLADDRDWMVLDAAGEVLTARTHRVLLRVAATPTAAGGLVLSAAGRSPLAVGAPAPAAAVPAVAVAGMSGMDRALPAGRPAGEWLSDVLGQPAQLVRRDTAAPRTLAAKHGGRPGDAFNLSDAGPVLLTTTASLRRLDGWLAERAAATGEEPVTMAMARFRPNLVVDGADLEPFAEDGWREVSVGEVRFRLGELCDRCAMTTIDPETLVGGKEPTRTLAAHRRRDGAVWFGIRLIPTSTGLIRLGDAVRAA